MMPNDAEALQRLAKLRDAVPALVVLHDDLVKPEQPVIGNPIPAGRVPRRVR